MNDKNDSLLEIATSLMKKKRKPQVLDSILEEVFQKKVSQLMMQQWLLNLKLTLC